MLSRTRSGHFNFLNRVRTAAEGRGWQVELAAQTDDPPERHVYALHHMAGPAHQRVKVFRRNYYYPFWHIETQPQRWRWPVANATFDPLAIDPESARRFMVNLRRRVLGSVPSDQRGHVLIALQANLLETRSFQTMSPVAMVAAIAQTGQACIATTHPNVVYSQPERAALERLTSTYKNLSMGTNSTELLHGAAFVATQNSSVGFDAYLMERPVILFAQIDFHHIALNVADIGVETALRMAPGHRPDYAAYLWWFLKEHSIDAMAADAEDAILRAMKKGGWPI